MADGIVKWRHVGRSYDFIEPSSGGKDVFVHVSALERTGPPHLVEGQAISYELHRDARSGKDSATNLRSA